MKPCPTCGPLHDLDCVTCTRCGHTEALPERSPAVQAAMNWLRACLDSGGTSGGDAVSLWSARRWWPLLSFVGIFIAAIVASGISALNPTQSFGARFLSSSCSVQAQGTNAVVLVSGSNAPAECQYLVSHRAPTRPCGMSWSSLGCLLEQNQPLVWEPLSVAASEPTVCTVSVPGGYTYRVEDTGSQQVGQSVCQSLEKA